MEQDSEGSKEIQTARACACESETVVERERDVHEGFSFNVILDTAIFRTKMSDHTRKSI